MHYCIYFVSLGGYNYYGTERMYSGSDGREMTASIFFGIVHYQRLRHMVLDKWQVIYNKTMSNKIILLIPNYNNTFI